MTRNRAVLPTITLVLTSILALPGCSRFASVFYTQENPQALKRDTIHADGRRTSTLDYAAGKANGVIELVPIEVVGATDSVTVSVPAEAKATIGTFETPRKLLVPRGFTAEVLAWNLGRPRDIAVAGDGTMFVSDIEGGRILAISPSGAVATVVTGVNRPHGLDLVGNRLFYAGITKLFRYDFEPGNPTGGSSTLLSDRIPDGGDFYTRTIRFRPADNHVYIAVGATDANGIEDDREHGTIFRVKETGGAPNRYLITGLRNTTGLAFHPTTGDLWGVDQGIDNLAENLAPEEVNILVSGGQYGHPFYYSQNFRNPKFADETGVQVPKSPTGPVIEMQPYAGASDAEFYSGTALGETWKNSLLVVFNGYESGAVIRPAELRTGGAVVRIRSKPDGTDAVQADLFSGWLTRQGEYWGRPVGVGVSHDGKSFFVTDEKNGVLYRFNAP